MEGNINGDEKKITIFMDKHYGLDEQTRCDSFDSMDISQYMYKQIINANEQIDFFLEISTSEIKNKQTNKRDTYINDLFEMFKSEFVTEKINDKDVVRYSKSNPNVRLHFLDIRDGMDLNDIRQIIQSQILINFKKLLNTKYNREKYSIQILNYFEQIHLKLDKLTNDKNEIIKLDGDYSKFTETDKQRYYINKIFNKYDNKELKHNLINFLNINYENIITNLDIVTRDIEKVLKNIEYVSIDKINEMYKHMGFVEEAVIDLYSLFVDCFLLRRMLDKNYISNSIIYTGTQHSIHYIFFLHKYYNFQNIEFVNTIII